MLFFCFHCSFTIMEPSGKGWPLPGTPALYAAIIVGLATITLSISSCRAEEATGQSSYPLKSENAIPLGDFSEYLSCALGEPAVLRVNSDGDEDGEHRYNHHKDREAGETFHLSPRLQLLYFLFLRDGFRRSVETCFVLLHKKPSRPDQLHSGLSAIRPESERREAIGRRYWRYLRIACTGECFAGLARIFKANAELV